MKNKLRFAYKIVDVRPVLLYQDQSLLIKV